MKIYHISISNNKSLGSNNIFMLEGLTDRENKKLWEETLKETREE